MQHCPFDNPTNANPTIYPREPSPAFLASYVALIQGHRLPIMVKKNEVIAIIIIVLFTVLALVSFGIWKLVNVARNSLSVTSGSSSSSSRIVDDDD
jgi:hypothetical protein